MTKIQALVFDFDGLILETESPIFQSWQELFQAYDQQLPYDKWAAIIGSSNVDFDPMQELDRLTGRELDWAVIEPKRRQRELDMIAGLPVLPGVEAYLEDARRLGLKIGLASSSPCDWVESHLVRLGLIEYFQTIIASDDVEYTKPDPALYRLAADSLGVPAGNALALEDSPNGVLAAKRAGLYCVAVPNEMTRHIAFEGEDLRLESLAEMPLEDLLRRLDDIP